MKKKFEYFLNAIHYCLWLFDIKFGDFMGKIVDVLLSPVPKYLFTKECKKKYYERLSKVESIKEKFFYDKECGYHIGWANHWFGYFYSGYPAFFSFAFGAYAMKNVEDIDALVKLLILAFPIFVCYIPAYRAVFTKDRYLKYFKQFEKEDKRWHKKWKIITILFCIGSCVAGLLGIVTAFLIFIC